MHENYRHTEFLRLDGKVELGADRVYRVGYVVIIAEAKFRRILRQIEFIYRRHAAVGIYVKDAPLYHLGFFSSRVSSAGRRAGG